MRHFYTAFGLLAARVLATLTPPPNDPFYTPTDNLQSSKPGTILKHRPVPNKLVDVAYSAAYQILYRTTDSVGNATAAVTTVIVPVHPDYSKLLSYQIVYDTPDVDCSPSYALQEGGDYIIDDGFTLGLNSGWVINTPDYEGLDAAYTAGVISGQATLDSIRAALASGSFSKIEPDATVAMWGYSGGALASEWASELQSSYAPELNISGSALGGLTPNVSSVAISINDSPNSGLIAAGVVGMLAAYPNISDFINSSFISTAKKNEFYTVKTQCIDGLEKNFYDQNIFGYFKQGESILAAPQIVSVVQAGGLMGVHGTPVQSNRQYWYKSTFDEISPVADTDALFQQYCEAGVDIQYVRDKFGNHEQESSNGGLGAFEFLMSIFEGTYNNTGCSVETKNKAGDVLSSSSITASSTPMQSLTSIGSPTAASASSMSTSSGAAVASCVSESGLPLVVSLLLMLERVFF